MNILNNVTQQASVFFSNNVVPAFSALNQKIALAAALAFGFIAACYFAVTAFISRSKAVELDKMDEKVEKLDVQPKEDKEIPLEETDEAVVLKAMEEMKNKGIMVLYTGPKSVKAEDKLLNFFPISLPAFLKFGNNTNLSIEDKLARQYQAKFVMENLQKAKEEADAKALAAAV